MSDGKIGVGMIQERGIPAAVPLLLDVGFWGTKMKGYITLEKDSRRKHMYLTRCGGIWSPNHVCTYVHLCCRN